MSAAGELEAYVRGGDLDGLVEDYLLVRDGARPNVVLREPSTAMLPASWRPSILVVAADLSDHDRPRENEQARRLIEEWLGAE
jgi:hypothetical protein